MTDDERRIIGTARRRSVLGTAHVERATREATPLNEEWLDFITRYAWGEVWTRPHFDTRTRRILVLGSMVALGRWEEYEMHVRAALVEGGFTMEDIKEILMQQAIYCGVPAANHAFALTRKVLSSLS